MLSSTPNGACRPNIQHGFCAAVLAQGLAPNVNIDVGKRSVVRLMQGQGKMNPVPPSTPGSIYNFLDCLSPIGRTLANGSLAE